MKKCFALFMILALALSTLCGVWAFAEGEEEKQAEDTEMEQADGPEDDAQTAEDPFEGLVRLGEQTDSCVMVKLTNMSESDNIMMINIKRSDDWEWSENLLLDGDTLDVNESAVLCYEPEEEEQTDGEEQGPVTYDLQIIYEGWTGGTCHNVPLDDVKDAQIMRAWNSIPYLVYTSVDTEEEVDMYEAEQQIAVAEYYANAQSQSGGSSSSGGGSSSSGSSEGCIGSGGLLY